MKSIVLGLAGLLATPAMALDPARCEWERAGYSEYERTHPVTDLGGGMVVQFVERDDAHAARDGLRVTDVTDFDLCISGRTIEVEGDHAPSTWEPLPRASEIVYDAVSAVETVTLERLRDRLRAAGFEARIRSAPREESCGCAVFYPELRGDKLPWTEGSLE